MENTVASNQNNSKSLMEYFSTPERPVKVAEFNTFWKSLTDADKQYYRTVNLVTGLVAA